MHRRSDAGTEWADDFRGVGIHSRIRPAPLAAGTTIDFEVAYTSDASNDNVGVIAAINLLK